MARQLPVMLICDVGTYRKLTLDFAHITGP